MKVLSGESKKCRRLCKPDVLIQLEVCDKDPTIGDPSRFNPDNAPPGDSLGATRPLGALQFADIRRSSRSLL
jgi:hypothetical protein